MSAAILTSGRGRRGRSAGRLTRAVAGEYGSDECIEGIMVGAPRASTYRSGASGATEQDGQRDSEVARLCKLHFYVARFVICIPD